MTILNPTDDPAYRLFQQRFGALRRSRQTEVAADPCSHHPAVRHRRRLDRFLARAGRRRHPPHRRVFRQAVFHRAEARRRPGRGPGAAASVRRREGTAVHRLLVLPDQHLPVAAVADHPDGHPVPPRWALPPPSRCRSPPRAPSSAAGLVVVTPPPAGGDAHDPAGRAGVYPGLAVRHRPACRDCRDRHPYHRHIGKAVLSS